MKVDLGHQENKDKLSIEAEKLANKERVEQTENTFSQTEKYIDNQTNKYTYRKTDRQETKKESCFMIHFFIFNAFNAIKILKKQDMYIYIYNI